MEAKARLFGHPVHQMLIVLPLGLLIAAWLADIGYFALRNPLLGEIGYWNTAGGIVSGLVAALFGFIDWLGIPLGTRAKRVGLWHASFNVVVLLLFAGSMILRHSAPSHVTNAMAFICATIAIGFASVSGWLGGELVNRLGIGVSPGAHSDAPSSLSGKPAGQERQTGR